MNQKRQSIWPRVADDRISKSAAQDLDRRFSRGKAGTLTYAPPAVWDKDFVPGQLSPKGDPSWTPSEPAFNLECVFVATQLPPPPLPTAAEFSQLRALAALREERKEQIEDQRGIEGFDFAIVGSFYAYGWPAGNKLRSLLHEVADAAEIVQLANKALHNRARPYQHWAYNKVKPMLHPGHPSFPSGHATRAFIYVELLRLVFDGKHPKKMFAAMWGAQRIAENREIAGVHYRTDSIAGALLAHRIVSHLNEFRTDYSKFDSLLSDAKAHFA
jgi:hypothetical protein